MRKKGKCARNVKLIVSENTKKLKMTLKTEKIYMKMKEAKKWGKG